jgi:hypothetical protein
VVKSRYSLDICLNDLNKKSNTLSQSSRRDLNIQPTEYKPTVLTPHQSLQNPCGGGVEYLYRDPASRKRRRNGTKKVRAIAQVVSRWFPTAAVRGSRPGLSCGILWRTKWRWVRFSPSTSVSPANFHSTNCSKNHPHLSSGFVQ